jgi:hypothetical protein
MKPYRRFSVSLHLAGRLALLSATAVLGVAAYQTPHIAHSQEATAVTPLPFTRAVNGADGQISAVQTAIRRFDPKDSSKPTIYLVAVTHIGEKAYYEEIQKLLDKQDLVLFEGVKPGKEEGAKSLEAQKADSEKLHVLQEKLARALGVQFQLDGIDYKRANFRNGDLSWDELMEAAQKSGPQSTAELTQLKAAMSGGGGPDAGPIGSKVNGAMDLLSQNPAALQMFRSIIVRTLADPDFLARLQKSLGQAATGTSPVAANKPNTLLGSGLTDSVLIVPRNKAVIQDLQKAEAKLRPGASVALFYGAGHMADMQRRLITELGYHAADVQWITALTVAAPTTTATAPATPAVAPGH